ncbi:O-fucosyltransferase family protein [Jatrophihabitans fulvus]
MLADRSGRPALQLIACLKPYAGLGNRVRVLLSARALAVAEQRRFAYCWPTGKPFGARLQDLWQFDEPEVRPAVVRALALRYRYRDETVEWRAAARRERRWLIRTSQPVQDADGSSDWWADLRALVPETGLAERIVEFHRRFLAGAPYVGVMIRAHQHSHAQSREQSPVSWFEQRMREIRECAPDVSFFVSCDVPEVQAALASQFGSTFGLADKGGYNSREAIRSAVVDLYLLAGAAHIIGPHYSSFPEMALHLAGGRVELETSATAAAVPDIASLVTRTTAFVTDPLRPAGR